MKKSKKIIILVVGIIVVILLIIGGIFLFKKLAEQQRNEDFEIATQKYYDDYMAALYGSDESVVTLKAIRNVIDDGAKDYNIKSLKKCSDDSSVTFKLENRKIVERVFDLKC